jgi:hypothetical protein
MHDTVTIYIQLLSDPDYGVLRPAQAEPLPNGSYRVLGPQDDDEEVWEFGPGSVVACREEERQEAGRNDVLLIAERRASDPLVPGEQD